MKWPEKHKGIVVEVICYLFILLFVYAAVSKLTDFGKFKAQLGQSPILTDFAGTIAILIPTIEIAIAGMLALPPLRRIALYACYYLMTLFTVYIIAVLNFSSHVRTQNYSGPLNEIHCNFGIGPPLQQTICINMNITKKWNRYRSKIDGASEREEIK